MGHMYLKAFPRREEMETGIFSFSYSILYFFKKGGAGGGGRGGGKEEEEEEEKEKETLEKPGNCILYVRKQFSFIQKHV